MSFRDPSGRVVANADAPVGFVEFPLIVGNHHGDGWDADYGWQYQKIVYSSLRAIEGSDGGTKHRKAV